MASPTGKRPEGDSVALRRLLRTPSRGLGTQITVLKAALAAGLSYALAVWVGPDRFAALAPVVAVFTVQGSVLGTLSQGVQRVLGTALGVGLTAVLLEWVGATWWVLFVAVLGALELARRLPIGFAGQAQIPISVLLTFALGTASSGYGPWRVIDSLIGGAVGIAVGILVPERPGFAAAQSAQYAWAEAIADQIETMAAELAATPKELADRARHGFVESSRALHGTAAAGRAATALAEEGVFFNPRARHQRDQLELLHRRERDLVRVTLEVRVLALTVDQLYDRPHVSPHLDRTVLASMLRSIARIYRRRRAGDDVTGESRELRREIARRVAAVSRDQADAYAVLDSVSMLGRLDQLRADVAGRHPTEAVEPRLEADLAAGLGEDLGDGGGDDLADGAGQPGPAR